MPLCVLVFNCNNSLPYAVGVWCETELLCLAMLPPCIFTLVLLTHNDLCLSGPPAVVALILAIKTWKVKIKTLNDSKYVAALVYISSVIVAVLALLSFAFGVYLNLTAVVYNGGILLITTIFLLLLFVPKVSVLYESSNSDRMN